MKRAAAQPPSPPALLAATLLLATCHRAAQVTPAPEVRHDTPGLARLIALPIAPVEAHWRARARGAPGLGPTDFEVEALLRFREPDADALLARAPIKQDGARATTPAWLRPFLPRAAPGEDDSGAGAASAIHEPTPFARSPLSHGQMIRLDRDHIFVSLFTM